MALDRAIKRYKPFAKGCDLGAATAPTREGRNHRAFEGPVQGIDHEPAFAIGKPEGAARADNRTLYADRVDQAQIFRREGAAVRQMQMNCNLGGLGRILFEHVFLPAVNKSWHWIAPHLVVSGHVCSSMNYCHKSFTPSLVQGRMPDATMLRFVNIDGTPCGRRDLPRPLVYPGPFRSAPAAWIDFQDFSTGWNFGAVTNKSA